MAGSFGTCPACGSANLAATVVSAAAKFKPNVDCTDCSTLLAFG
jgi:transcription elongation factor Elf1